MMQRSFSRAATPTSTATLANNLTSLAEKKIDGSSMPVPVERCGALGRVVVAWGIPLRLHNNNTAEAAHTLFCSDVGLVWHPNIAHE